VGPLEGPGVGEIVAGESFASDDGEVMRGAAVGALVGPAVFRVPE
jgi:hypothetical protein